jgi:hypothetical protein
MQNKANLPGGAGGVGRGMLYKQSQLPEAGHRGGVRRGRAGRGDKGAGRRANAPNKPNFGGGKSRDKCLAGKDLWLTAHSIGLGQTKPISEGVPSVRCQVLSRTRRAGSPRSLPTSNFTLPPDRRRGFLYKQSQFWPRQNERQVVCWKEVMAERTCKEHWRNKANSRPGRGFRMMTPDHTP